ncbi:ABC transporter substrate-binding protein [Actinocorallia populi]|uniref:ABC transporter substrate-binding protein n=1 Tax=Actinocorallia populi TaxID=2079200 RepID=UPI000D087BE4|nr:ABC transporter substrate-binding protein [Actinocorallia populi]
MTRSKPLACAALLLTIVLGACGTGPRENADGTTTVRYQGQVGGVTPIELAGELGHLPGIELEWIGNTISGPQDIQSVATGQTEIGGAFNGAIVKLVAAGSPIRAVISYYGSDAETAIGFWTLEDSPIKGPRDLIGKKIAVNTLGAHLEAVIKEYLQRGGLTPEEIEQVELVVVPPVNAEQSLRQGQVDVASLNGVLKEKALERGGVEELFNDVELLGGEFNAGSYVLRNDFVEKNPEAARTLVTGVGQALDWVRTQPRKAVLARFEEIVSKRGRNEDSSSLKYFKGYGVSSQGGRIADGEFGTWIDWLAREGEVEPGIKPADVFTNEFNQSKEPAK